MRAVAVASSLAASRHRLTLPCWSTKPTDELPEVLKKGEAHYGEMSLAPPVFIARGTSLGGNLKRLNHTKRRGMKTTSRALFNSARMRIRARPPCSQGFAVG